ncbi:hypothetical protein BC830DRAFT_658231 [Chytriomyces sp. MP71]|nr:hypothetical protein BC830DRAFT_658231 [Chytriomyces sp. MP71]
MSSKSEGELPAVGTVVDSFFYAGPSSQYAPSYAKRSVSAVKSAPVQVAIIHNNGAFSALRNACAHLGSPLHNGSLADIEDVGAVAVVCRRHGWSFHATTGRCVLGGAGNEEEDRVPVHHVRVDDTGGLWVSVDPIQPQQ